MKKAASHIRARGKIPHHEWPKIAERFRNGETLAEIARSYQCTAPAIRYIVGRVSTQAEEADTDGGERADTAAPAPGDATVQVLTVKPRAQPGRRFEGSPPGPIWDRVSSEIASFLAGMDALSEDDSDENYEALLVATDRLLWASARTRLEVERVLDSRKSGTRRRAP